MTRRSILVALSLMLSLSFSACGLFKKDDNPPRTGPPVTDAKPPKDWNTSPAQPGAGLTGPTVPKRGGFNKTMWLGTDGSKKGDPRNKAEVPEFTCSSNAEYCTVTFYGSFNAKDNEQIRVHVSSGVNNSVTGYIKDRLVTSQVYSISLPGACGKKINVTFDWGKKGTNAQNIESKAHLWGVQYQCTTDDRTNNNVHGKLYNARGQKL